MATKVNLSAARRARGENIKRFFFIPFSSVLGGRPICHVLYFGSSVGVRGRGGLFDAWLGDDAVFGAVLWWGLSRLLSPWVFVSAGHFVPLSLYSSLVARVILPYVFDCVFYP